MIIEAKKIEKALHLVEIAKVITAQDMPKSAFVFKGIDNDKIYFRIVCKNKDTNEQQIRDIQEKTPFGFDEISIEPFFKAECWQYI